MLSEVEERRAGWRTVGSYMSEKVGKIQARCVDWCIRCVRKHWVNDFCWRWTVRVSRGFHYKPTLTGSRFQDSLSSFLKRTHIHPYAQYLLINQLMEVNRARNKDQDNWRRIRILPEEVLKHNRMTKINWNDAMCHPDRQQTDKHPTILKLSSNYALKL